MKKVGLYFGSFNPIHIGHLIIAQSFLDETDLKEIWFVVSPQNPLKSPMELADANDRLKMVSIAIQDNKAFKYSDIEFDLPKPSYTITTLEELDKRFSQNNFSIIMGADNLESFHKWKDYERILENYSLYVYPRAGCTLSNETSGKIIKCKDFPFLDISSTYIRSKIQSGKSVRYLLPEKVLNYIQFENLYR